MTHCTKIQKVLANINLANKDSVKLGGFRAQKGPCC